jgi:hypothetical protein
MVFIPESEVFFVCNAIVFKAFQRGPTKYFLQKKILFHVDLIKMLSLISLFLRFPSYFPQNSGQQKYKAYLFKLSSHLIVERHLPTIASDAYGIGFVEETRTTRDQYCGCICGTRDHIFNIHSVQLSYSCLELRLDRI